MRLHRLDAEKERRGHLAVRRTGGDEPRHLVLLRRQRLARHGLRLEGGAARRPQIRVGLAQPGPGAAALKRLRRQPQLHARVDPPSCPPQRHPVGEEVAGFHGLVLELRVQVDRAQEVRIDVPVGGEQPPAARLHRQE